MKYFVGNRSDLIKFLETGKLPVISQEEIEQLRKNHPSPEMKLILSTLMELRDALESENAPEPQIISLTATITMLSEMVHLSSDEELQQLTNRTEKKIEELSNDDDDPILH